MGSSDMAAIWKVRYVGTREKPKQAKGSSSPAVLSTKEDPVRNEILPISLKEREGGREGGMREGGRSSILDMRI